MITANAFAYIALFGWPIIAIILFARMTPERAAIWSIIAGYLLLPTGLAVDKPLLPPLDKTNIIVLSTLLLCFIRSGAVPRSKTEIALPLLSLMYILSPIMSTFNNNYELQFGYISIPGHYLADGIKGSMNNLIVVSAFLIGYRFLASSTARTELVKALVLGIVAYSILMLWEARFSPQLHRLVYGYSMGSFALVARWGGYRPTVFLPQGLQLALLVCMALIGSCALARARIKLARFPIWAAGVYLMPLLVVCKTLGAFIYAAIALPFAIFSRASIAVKVASAAMIFILAYPALRSQSFIPLSSITGLAARAGAEREGSLRVRLTNEDRLLAKANEKPFFGWGGWGRNRIYDSNDSKDITITDGGWIIYYGIYGWFGYIGLFGIFAVSVFRAQVLVRTSSKEDGIIIAGIALMLAVNMLDMLPNANLTPITFLLAGSIARRPAKRNNSATKDGVGRRVARQRNIVQVPAPLQIAD